MSTKKTVVESKALGIPLPETVAREVDQLVKTLPKECSYRRKGTLPDTQELVSGERADISMVSVESVDRDGDIVLAKGMQLDSFQRNPIVTLAHKYDELPVGRAQWVKKVRGGIRAKTVYSEATETSRAVWQMTQEGILRGKSLGFLPMKIRAPSQEEISKNPNWKHAGAIIETAVLLEYAVAPIPVNQDALVEAVSKGKADRETLERLGFKVPLPKQLSADELAEIILKEFEKHARRLTPERIKKKLLEQYRA